ncbi:MAG: PEP-CTERM sorting domain-containing protein, partial [Oceanipulchritudo sp.]
FGVSIPAFYNGSTNTIRFDYDVTQTNVGDRLTVSFNGSPVALAASGNSNGTPTFVALEHSFGIGTINLRGSASTFSDITVDSFTAAVPEPGTYGLLLGALALGGVLLRRRLGR